MAAIKVLNRLAGASAGLGIGAFLLNESLYNGTSVGWRGGIIP